MYISLWDNSWGHPDNVSFMQFSTKIDGFEQKGSQGFENSHNSYEQYPLEKFLIFTIYQNYTLALKVVESGSHLQSQNVRLDKNNGMYIVDCRSRYMYMYHGTTLLKK